MIGLPGDTMDRFLHTLDLIIPLRPNFLRIHPTLVLREHRLKPSGVRVAIFLSLWMKPSIGSREASSHRKRRRSRGPHRAPAHPRTGRSFRCRAVPPFIEPTCSIGHGFRYGVTLASPQWETTSRPLLLSSQGDVHSPGPAEWPTF